MTVTQLAKAVRVAFVCLVLIFTACGARLTVMIQPAERIFEDMLGAGSQLPILTRFVFIARTPIVAVASIMPLLCLLTLLDRKIIRAIYTLAWLAVGSIILNVFLWHAITEPFVEVIRRMQGAPP